MSAADPTANYAKSRSELKTVKPLIASLIAIIAAW